MSTSPPQTPPTPPHLDKQIFDPVLSDFERSFIDKATEEFNALCRSRILRVGSGVFQYSFRGRTLKADLVRDDVSKKYFLYYDNILISSPNEFVKYITSSSLEKKSSRISSSSRDIWTLVLYRGTPLNTFRGSKPKKRDRRSMKSMRRRVTKTTTTKLSTAMKKKSSSYCYISTETSCASIVSPTCMMRWISQDWKNSDRSKTEMYYRTSCEPKDISFIPVRYGDKQKCRRSEYARGRLRTDLGRSSLKYSTLARQISLGQVDPLSMIRCEHYGEQPFRVVVSPRASFLCDFHAHLSYAEIIGLLCGRWDRKSSTLYIERAFPCRSLDLGCEDDVYTNVEMDPTSELQVREIASREGLQVVGWYHSHPTFQTDPSVRDIENQSSYQRLFRESNNRCSHPVPTTMTTSVTKDISSFAPFVGLIVGPFDSSLPSTHSWHQYFFVSEKSKTGFGIPMHCNIEYEKYILLSTAEKDDDDNSKYKKNERQELYFNDPREKRNTFSIEQEQQQSLPSPSGDRNNVDDNKKKTTITFPLQPETVWNRFFQLCNTISKAKTSKDIETSLSDLRKYVLNEENRREGLHWVKCMRDVVNLVNQSRLSRPLLWTNEVAKEYANLLKSLRESIPGYQNHMKAIAHALRMTRTYGPDMQDLCAQVVDLVNYYSSQSNRLRMNEVWKGLKKREKVRRSMLPWLKLLPLDSSLRVDFVNDCMDYIRYVVVV